MLFPTSPVYAYYYEYTGSGCGTHTTSTYYLANTCLNGSHSSTKVFCDNGIATLQRYHDASCSNPDGSGFVMSSTCVPNPHTDGDYNSHYVGGCGSTAPAYSSEAKWDIEGHYYSTGCGQNQVVTAKAYRDSYCYSYSYGEQSFKYKFPTVYYYSASRTCTSPATSFTNVSTTCAAANDDDQSVGTYLKWSQHTPDNSGGGGNSTTSAAVATISMSMKLLLSAVSVAFYFMKN